MRENIWLLQNLKKKKNKTGTTTSKKANNKKLHISSFKFSTWEVMIVSNQMIKSSWQNKSHITNISKEQNTLMWEQFFKNEKSMRHIKRLYIVQVY